MVRWCVVAALAVVTAPGTAPDRAAAQDEPAPAAEVPPEPDVPPGAVDVHLNLVAGEKHLFRRTIVAEERVGEQRVAGRVQIVDFTIEGVEPLDAGGWRVRYRFDRLHGVMTGDEAAEFDSNWPKARREQLQGTARYLAAWRGGVVDYFVTSRGEPARVERVPGGVTLAKEFLSPIPVDWAQYFHAFAPTPVVVGSEWRQYWMYRSQRLSVEGHFDVHHLVESIDDEFVACRLLAEIRPRASDSPAEDARRAPLGMDEPWVSFRVPNYRVRDLTGEVVYSRRDGLVVSRALSIVAERPVESAGKWAWRTLSVRDVMERR